MTGIVAGAALAESGRQRKGVAMNLWLGLLGVVPFLLLFLGLTLSRLPAYLVAFGVLLTTLLLAVFAWKTPGLTLAQAAGEGAVTALVPIVWVIFAAVFTYFVSVETGAMETIKAFLVRLTPDPRIQAVLIAFCFGGFLEAVAGFGTAVAIPTAMLISLGFDPVKASVVSLVANSVPVAFGALGIPVIALGDITHLDTHMLTRYVAVQLLPFCLIIPFGIATITNNGLKGIGNAVKDVLAIGVLFSLMQTAVAFFVGPELVAVSASLFALLGYVGYRSLNAKLSTGSSPKKLLFAVVNFIILLVLVLGTRLPDFPVLKQYPLVVHAHFGLHEVKIDYLTTPGTLLLFSAVVGGLLQGLRPRKLASIAWMTAKRIKFSALTIIFILVLAKSMGASGMVTSVAEALALLSGSFFPFVSPLLGAIGTFVTGSDTSSNILLGELQKQTAQKLQLNPEWITAANTSGATGGKMISPQSLAVATSTVGIESRQGEILRKNLFYCAAYVAALGIYVGLVAILR